MLLATNYILNTIYYQITISNKLVVSFLALFIFICMAIKPIMPIPRGTSGELDQRGRDFPWQQKLECSRGFLWEYQNQEWIYSVITVVILQ